MDVAVLNVGTGTVKAARYATTASESEQLDRQVLPRDSGAPLDDLCESALRAVGAERESVRGIGHRIVHGGTELVDPTVIDPAVEAILEGVAALAPLHNPAALEGLRVARLLAPDRPMIAVFDTAFHAGRPDASRRYALPWKLTEELALYRYGFHGIAHASLVESLARAQACPSHAVDAVTLQLGSGCSACAVRGGRSIETSMGFSPLEGLAMPTRAGDLDAAVVLHLLRRGYSVAAVEHLLQHESGLLGIADSADVRVLLVDEGRGNPRAAMALAIFVQRIVSIVGGYWTLLEGRGPLVFGGGIGTHCAEIRRRICERLRRAWGVVLDPDANAEGRGRVSRPDSRPVWVFETDEELQIARAVAGCLSARLTG